MKAKTNTLFNAITVALAATHGVSSMAKQFNVDPTIEQKLYDEVYESAELLQMINTVPVDDLVGQSVMMTQTGSVTGRAGVETDDSQERNTTDVSNLTDREYRCYPVECDVHLPWPTMDAWSKFPDFHKKYRAHVKKAIALDMIKVGWNGTHAAPKTNRTTHPMLQDVNIGWLQLLRRDNSANVITAGEHADEIRIGEGGDYENLDQAINDAKSGIPLHLREGLVAIVGEELLAEDKNKLYAKQAHTPSEKTKIEMKQVIETYGGLPTYEITFFPPRGILITSFENLSWYYQNGSTRTSVIDNVKKKRVEDYQSRNDCYYIEDLDKAIYLESDNIKVPNKAGDAWV